MRLDGAGTVRPDFSILPLFFSDIENEGYSWFFLYGNCEEPNQYRPFERRVKIEFLMKFQVV